MTIRSKRIVIATIGSLGDLHPCLAIGLALRDRGHHVTVASTEIYRARVRDVGLDFRPMRPNFAPDDPEVLRRVMEMRRGPEILFRELLLPELRGTYDDLMAAAADADLLIAGEIVFAASLVAEKLRLPWASAILSPASFLSAYDPPVLPPAPVLARLRGFGPLVNRSIFALGKAATRHWWKPVVQLRSELGLADGRNPFFQGKFSPHLVLALFSRELAGPQPDWPPNTIQTGFVYYDRGVAQAGLSVSLEAFIETGDPPIVFTLGSAAVNAPGGFFEESVRAAVALGRRAVLLIGDNPMPGSLPPEIIAEAYAPYSELFSRSVAVVHQGGVGTTAQALRSGRPMLITPYGFDQPDNAARVRRLGAGLAISKGGYKGKKLQRLLDELLSNPSYAARAGEIGRRLRLEQGTEAACSALDTLLQTVD